MGAPLLSIVIPTRNREYYCIEAIKDILSYKRQDFELCICDNSDSEEIERFVETLGDSRVVYHHTQGRINFIINSDMAMQMATGDYICMIGDDDTILPDIFEVTLWAKNHNYDNVSPIDTITYYWPKSMGPQGILQWTDREINNSFVVKDCRAQINTFVKNGYLTYYDYLPRVYHGLVKRDIMERVKSITGHMVGGVSPDIYMSIAVALLCPEFIITNRIISVAGACPKSATAVSNTGGHRGRIEEAPHLYKRGDYVWDNRIPKIYTVQTIWAETAMKAFSELGRNDLCESLNQGFLYADMFRKNPNMYRELWNSIKGTRLLGSKLFVLANFAWYFLSKFTHIFYRNRLICREIQNVDNITMAVKLFMEEKV